tara:strand:- start:765 stop:872 length:108 start_codon:yes stop_codon:yes gene_type:complete
MAKSVQARINAVKRKIEAKKKMKELKALQDRARKM